jgi:hypothetical protein
LRRNRPRATPTRTPGTSNNTCSLGRRVPLEVRLVGEHRARRGPIQKPHRGTRERMVAKPTVPHATKLELRTTSPAASGVCGARPGRGDKHRTTTVVDRGRAVVPGPSSPAAPPSKLPSPMGR